MKESNIKYDIGIVSLWTWKNYGTCLTYYALYKVLKGMGNTVRLFERPLNSYAAPPRLAESRGSKVGLFAQPPYQPSELQVPLETRGEMRDACDECETLMVGSDQFFNNSVNAEFGKVFYFDWVPDGKRKIVYAASWGRDEAWGTELDTKLMSYYLARFDAFSVREKSTVQFIKEAYGRDAEFVLDPVFLCPREQYDTLATEYEADLQNSPYIFSYTLEPTEEKARVLRSVGEKLGLPLHVISDPHYSEDYVKEAWSMPCEMEVCEERWIALIKNSAFIVTDSFHGMCLAVIYKKPFIAISNPVRGRTRFESIGSLLGLQGRIIENLEDIDFSCDALFAPIDYAPVDAVLATEKERSLRWLKNALQVQEKPERAFNELDALKAHIEDIDLIAARNGYRISLVEKHGADVDNRFLGNEERIANVEIHGANVDKRFDFAEERIASVERHGVDVDARFLEDEKRIFNVEKHGVEVDGYFASLGERVHNVEVHGVHVDRSFEAEETHIRTIEAHVQEVLRQLDEQKQRSAALEAELASLKRWLPLRLWQKMRKIVKR